MKQRLKTFLLAALFIAGVAAPAAVVGVPQEAFAANKGADCEKSIMGIPPWYRGLTNMDDKCSLKGPDDVGGISNYIWRIVLNGIEMALVIAAYVAVFFIIYGGFLFMTGGDNAGQVEKARKTLLDAVIGLVIVLSGVAITKLIFSILT